MKLLEYQAKGLFARHGIGVPKGTLWPDLPDDVTGYVVKAQIPAGGRGSIRSGPVDSKRCKSPAAQL